ncbi:MAG: AbrB/MazE/SpoVT family DNA-binding domain-containing protein [Thermoplasmata archaeon]
MVAPAVVTAHRVKSDGTLAAVIPKHLRERLHIVKGTRLLAYEDRGRLVLQRLDDFTGASEEKQPQK